MHLRWLEHPRAHLGITALALVLLLPALGNGLLLDDHVLALKARSHTEVAGLRAEPLWLFTFTTGDVVQNRLLMDEGVLLPWWSDPHHLNAFFRPLSSLTHVLDFALWPHTPWLMHVQSLLWYAALLLVVAHVYRSLQPTATSAALGLSVLALVIYAFDDAHGATVGWIANRNAVIAATLALPALSSLHRWRTGGFAPGAWLGPLCFALGLCAGETAISIFGYLVAYVLCLDRGTLKQRALLLLPYVGLILAHRGIYRVFGLGSFGSSAYHDPVREPVAFALALAYNLPVLLSAQLGAPLADFAFWSDPSVRAPLLAFSCLSLLVLGWLALPLLRRDAHARFWSLGMLLAAVPVSASLPGERLLLCVGIGAAQLLALLIAPLLAASPLTAADMQSKPRMLIAGALVLAHLLLAPLLLPVRANAMGSVGKLVDRIDASVPSGADIEDKTLIVINAPVDLALSYMQTMRASRGVPRPLHVHWLASASSKISVTRTEARTLRVSLERGFLRRPEETHYRADASALGVGARVALAELDARVVALTAEGLPKTVDFSFAKRLDSTRYLFMYYRDGVLVPWRVPSLGGIEQFDAQDFFQLMAREGMR